MHFSTVSLLAAALPAALAWPSYTIPRSFARIALAGSCTYPEAFEIQNFQTWNSSTGNDTTAWTMSFGYSDKLTNINTSCQRNATSENVGSAGLTARYACDDANVEFIWQRETLTVLEVACPGNTGSNRWEASGSVKPALSCAGTSCNSTMGDGRRCVATVPTLEANFTSLQPTPS